MKKEEGMAKIEVPGELERSGGFYNPEMRENRDISVATLKIMGSEFKERSILDAFSATGIRSIRYCLETSWKPVATEVNERAFELLEKNKRSNNCEFRAELEDCKILMMREKFQAIDIDPYGSPAQFIYPAFSGLDKQSLLMVTATDTANLFGVYPRKAFRLYGYRGIRDFSQKEMGIRMLLSFIMKTGAMMGKAFSPLISFSYKHYARVVGMVKRSRRDANKILGEFENVRGEEYYMGSIQNQEFLKSLLKELAKPRYAQSSEKLVSIINSELDAPFYYDTHKFGSVSMKEAQRKIEEARGKFSRTHFSPTAFKTDLPEEEVLRLFKHK